MEFITPLIGQLGLGGILGFCVGYLAKKAIRVLALLAGLIFILLQVLSYYGFISINWETIATSFDGAVYSGAVDGLLGSLMTILKYKLPFGAAFAGGLALGIKKG